MRFGRADHRVARRIEQKDQVDIAGIVELTAAELAHAEDDQAAVALRVQRVRRLDRAARSGGVQEVPHRRAEGRLGEPAQRRHLLFEGPAPGNLGNSGDQGRLSFREAQPSHQRCLAFAGIGALFDARRDLVEQSIRPVLDITQEEGPFGDRKLAEKRAVAEQCSQQAFPRFRGGPGAGDRGAAVVRRFGERRVPSGEAQFAQPRIGRPRQRGVRSGEVQ